MMFFVWEKNEKSEDVRNENVDVVEVSLLNTLQLLRDEVDKNLEIKKKADFDKQRNWFFPVSKLT